MNNNLNKINCKSFSIVFDESHLFTIPKFNMDPSKKKNLDKMNTTIVSIDRNETIKTEFNTQIGSLEQSKKLLIDDEKKKKKSWFARLCCCFS